MGGFAAQIAGWVDRSKDDIDKVIQEVVYSMSTTIVSRTPIGDRTLWKSKAPKDYRPGTLVNNWHAGTGRVPGSISMREPNVTGATSLADIERASRKAAGDIYYLVNPAPYAVRIEYGNHSTQAPQGMVRLTVQKYQMLVKGAISGVT